MAEITNLSEVRRKKEKKRSRRGFALIVLILALTVILSLLFSGRDEYGVSSVMDLFQTGSGYPVDAPGGKSKGMYSLDGLLCISNDTDLMMYNSKGAEVFAVKHQMADPQVSISNKMLLMFDQGAKSFALYQSNVPVTYGETDHVIYTGTVSDKGLFALATRSEDYLSQVTVFDRNKAVKYTWNYSDKVITSVALSPSGNKLAVSGLYTEDGIIKSQLLLYNNGDLVDSRDFDDEILCSIVFVGESEIRGVSDQGAFLISDKGKLMGEYDYKAQPLAAFYNSAEATVLLLGDYRQTGGYEVVALNHSINRQSSTTIKGNIHVLKADAHNAYILAGNNYYQIDLQSGEHLVEEEAEYIYDLQPIGKGVFAITNEEIVRMEQVEAENREMETHVVPEQNKKEDELEDWETPEEIPSEEADIPEEIPDEETDVQEEEVLPQTGTAAGDPGL